MLPELETPAYSQRTVLKVTGLAPATLQNWANRGLIQLSERNPGRQSRRLYSQLDMMRLVTVRHLTRAGIAVARAVEFAEQVVIKEAYRQIGITEKENQTGRPIYGQGCTATFYYENDELICRVDNNALQSSANAFGDALRRDIVRIVVEVSDIVYYVRVAIAELNIQALDRLIAEQEAEELRGSDA